MAQVRRQSSCGGTTVKTTMFEMATLDTFKVVYIETKSIDNEDNKLFMSSTRVTHDRPQKYTEIRKLMWKIHYIISGQKYFVQRMSLLRQTRRWTKSCPTIGHISIQSQWISSLETPVSLAGNKKDWQLFIVVLSIVDARDIHSVAGTVWVLCTAWLSWTTSKVK